MSLSHIGRPTASTFAAGTALLFSIAPSSTQACSICRCGDPTYNALGGDGVEQTGLRLALDWDQVEKTQGPSDELDSITERRETLLVAYGVNDRLGLFARIPYSERSLTETVDGEAEKTSASGLADPELYAQVRVWSSQFRGDVGRQSSVFLLGGVKTDWGNNDIQRNGERLDEHVQPGTGSVDEFVGVAGSYQVSPQSAIFASAQYRNTGRNDAGYKYGNTTLLNVAYDRKLSARWDVVLEADYRNALRDEVDSSGENDPNTGGSITYLTPRVLFSAGHGWVLRASAQFPLYQGGLNGQQEEKTVLNVGVTYLVGK
jgi:hypothetical protein